MKVLLPLAMGIAITATTIGAANSQPAPSSSDLTAPLTRAQVKAELVDWIAAGHDPLNWLVYPSSTINANRRVAERRAQGTTPQGTPPPYGDVQLQERSLPH